MMSKVLDKSIKTSSVYGYKNEHNWSKNFTNGL